MTYVLSFRISTKSNVMWIPQSIGFADVLVDPITSTIYHIESRPSDPVPGRNVLVNTATGNDTAIAYDGVVYFSHLDDGRVYFVSEGTQPEAAAPGKCCLRPF